MRISSLFFFFTIFLFSCQEQSNDNEYSKKNVVRYAQHLSIVESKDGALVKILSPETGKVELEMNLSRQLLKTKNLVQVPINKMAVLSSTHVGMLEKLSAVESIVGIVDKKYVYNPSLLKRVKEKQVIELGEEGQIPVESIIKSKCEAMIYSGFGKEFPHEKQLRKVGIKFIVNYDWREAHPLGKAEWILLFGYLTGKEKEAKAYFNEIEQEYLTLKSSAKHLKDKPTVLSGHLWGESWFAPGGKSFEAQFLRDANVDYKYANTDETGSLSLSIEKVLADNLDTKFWINPGFPTQDELFGPTPRLKYLGPVLDNNIYDYTGSGNRYWEMSAIEPQKVLFDYLSIFHPEEFPRENLYFYHQVK